MIRNRTHRNRRGFSLIELLTVVSILGLLTAIFVGVLVSVRGDSATRTTNETLNKIQAAIEQQVRIAGDVAKKERRDRAAAFTQLVPFCNNDEDRAEALLVVVKVRLQFPTSFAEATSPVTLSSSPLISYPAPAAFRSVTGTFSAQEQAAILLYLSLGERSTATDGVNTDQISQSDLAGTSYKVFRDAWGSPITYVRFAQNAELNQPTYAPAGGARDPFDPRGKLAAAWTNRAAAENALNLRFDGLNKVVTAHSAGKDKVLDTANNALASDDVWGYRVRKQGQKTD